MKRYIMTTIIFFLFIIAVFIYQKTKPEVNGDVKTVDELKEIIVQSGYYDDKKIIVHEQDSLSGTMSNGWNIVFLDLDDSPATASFMYTDFESDLNNRENVIKHEEENLTISECDSNDAYGERYFLIVRKKNTLLQIIGPKKDKTAIRKFASNFNYYK